MVKHIILNFALINEDGKYRAVDHCTTYADNDIDIMRFTTESARDKFIADNQIVIADEETV